MLHVIIFFKEEFQVDQVLNCLMFLRSLLSEMARLDSADVPLPLLSFFKFFFFLFLSL